MRITVTRSGGFAGLRLERSVDTTGRADAPEWEELVRTARLDSVPAASRAPGQPDRYTYRVDVDGREVTVPEQSLTGPLHTLVQKVLAEG
ncbi:MAG TPA: protealysin inhibitor emfourin [Mycobacteriales bacterium]|nr:protealysin inhibitor emfourin [Mycobacteriales bacterium]